MIMLKFLTFSFLFCGISAKEWNTEEFGRNVFDKGLHERVLDPELCREQLSLITSIENLSLAFQFHDAGARFPRGVLGGNLQDWGQYHQCLAIRTPMGNDGDDVIQGKYCSLSVPLNQGAALPSWIQEESQIINLDPDLIQSKSDFDTMNERVQVLTGARTATPGVALGDASFIFGICIPKSCTTADVIDVLTNNGTLVNFEYTEQFCRLPDDKPFSPADIVAVSIFSILAFLMLLSTSYDLIHNFVNKRDPKQASTLLCSFSLYTNTRRLLSFNYAPDALHSLDGIRALAMLWVVIGHVWSTYALTTSNGLDVFNWTQSVGSVWILAAPITVDTFFMMTGLLLVYTTAGKLSQKNFLKRLHLFYILRFLRLLPLLAIVILLQASLVHHMSDGPRWHTFALMVEKCRSHWWGPLTFLQNYVNFYNQCLGPTWYLCVEMQLFWVSPLVLVWVLGGRIAAWISLTLALMASLIIVTVYCFIFNFPLSTLRIQSEQEAYDYYKHYYLNTLTRASPFFVGMIIGYVLHLWRGRKIKIPKIVIIVLWLLTMGLLTGIIFVTYPTTYINYDNRLLDNFMNAYMRGVWAACLGWIVIASTHGYGGPVNWLLSLNLWKLPARLSYAVYLTHFSIMQLVQATFIRPLHYSTPNFIYRFFADVVLSFLAAFLLTLAVDSPFSTLQKLLIGGGKKSPPPALISKPPDYEKAPEASDFQNTPSAPLEETLDKRE